MQRAGGNDVAVGRFTSRELFGLALATGLALIAAIALAILPVYSGRIEGRSSTGETFTATTRGTLIGENGLVAVMVLLLPVAVTLAPLTMRTTSARRVALRVAAGLMTVFVVLGALSIGLFYVPATLALWVAASGRRRAA